MADETSEGYKTIWKAPAFRDEEETAGKWDTEGTGRKIFACEALRDLANLLEVLENGTEVRVTMKKPEQDSCELKGRYGGINNPSASTPDIFIQVGHDYVEIFPITHFAVRK
jgi:hypothetical protein